MFDYCKVKEKKCAFACDSTYDPEEGKHLWKTNTFCGAMTGSIDIRVDKLSLCWLDMSNGQRTKHTKKVNNEVMPKRGYYYNKMRKAWIRIGS